MAAATSEDPLEGALLDGRYRVATKIATGGTSTVYRGLDTRLDRPVALKVMDSRYSGDQQFLTRFQLEARSVARLKDPGLVAVYDQGLDGRHPFLVMELVEGGTLRELLAERGPMPPHAVAAVLRPVLGGLAAAHRAGLVHRDVKPENVLISDEGDVKIVDFGLVRAVAEAGITSTSVILGTAAYLSPEQVKDGTASPRSDVYAAGIVAYELLTGQTPFSGDTALSVAYQRLDTDVPLPGSVISGVPSQFDDLVERATARDPANRYADAQDMGAELDAIVDGVAPARLSGAFAAQFGATSLGRGSLQSGRPESDHRPQPHDRSAPATRHTSGAPSADPSADSRPDERIPGSTRAIRRHRPDRVRPRTPACPAHDADLDRDRLVGHRDGGHRGVDRRQQHQRIALVAVAIASAAEPGEAGRHLSPWRSRARQSRAKRVAT